MHRIDNDKASATLPTPEAVGPNPDSYFQLGTKVTHDWLNALQEEICYVIEEDSITLDKTLQDQLYDAIQNMIADGPSTSGIAAVVDDPAPKLGGDLNCAGFLVTSASNGDVEFNAPDYIAGGAGGYQAQIHTNIYHLGDLNTLIQFGTDTQTFQTGGSTRFDLTSAGMQINGSGARVNAILNENTMSSDSDTALTTQAAFKAYVDSTFTAKGEVLAVEAAVRDPFGLTQTGWGLQTNYTYANNANNCLTVTRSGTIKNLYVNLLQQSTSGGTVTYACTVYKNGSSTSLTVSDSRTAVNGDTFTLSDTTHTVSVSAGDTISLHLVGTGTDTFYIGNASILFE